MYWQKQYDQLSSVVIDVVREAAPNVLFDDSLRSKDRAKKERIRMGNADFWSDQSLQDFTHRLPIRALENINIVLVSSAGQRMEDILLPMHAKMDVYWKLRKMNFDFLGALLHKRVSPVFFDVLTAYNSLGPRENELYDWEWHGLHYPFLTHIWESRLCGGGYQRNSWEIEWNDEAEMEYRDDDQDLKGILPWPAKQH